MSGRAGGADGAAGGGMSGAGCFRSGFFPASASFCWPDGRRFILLIRPWRLSLASGEEGPSAPAGGFLQSLAHLPEVPKSFLPSSWAMARSVTRKTSR